MGLELKAEEGAGSRWETEILMIRETPIVVRRRVFWNQAWQGSTLSAS